jgi:hypothetical protein
MEIINQMNTLNNNIFSHSMEKRLHANCAGMAVGSNALYWPAANHAGERSGRTTDTCDGKSI